MMLSFLLLLVTLIAKSLSLSYDGLSDELRFIHREMGSLRDENYKQNMEIASLKETVQLQNKTINRQEKTIKKLFTANHRMIRNDRPVSPAAQSLGKKPVRLLPVSMVLEKINNEINRQDRNRFYGPPTNCSDLTRLGYILNGYYLVKNPALSDDLKKTTKLETVFCAFEQEGTHNPLLVQQEVIPPPSSLDFLPSSSSSPPPKLDQEIFKTTNAIMVINSTTSTSFSPPPKLDQWTYKTTNANVVFNSTTTSIFLPMIKLYQELFKTTPRSAVFNSTTSTALMKKVTQSSCIPLWQLKIVEPMGIHCLSVEHMKNFGDRPILEKCENPHPLAEQKWSMIESENAAVRICQETLNQCLTFAFGLTYLPDYPHVSLKVRDEKSKGQLFKMNNETSQLMIVESGSCSLVGILRARPLVSGVGVHGCNETTDNVTFKEWSIVPLNNCLYKRNVDKYFKHSIAGGYY